MNYADVAYKYKAAGWAGVLPLPHAQKTPPPDGYTGRNGTDPTTADIQTWIDWSPELTNVALRLPPNVVGIDVDAYGNKPGRHTLQRLADDLGPLPHTVMSTSRTDGISGIRLYRVTPQPSWSDPGPGIEIIHHGWRYIVAWPSTHDKTGNTYKWIDTDTGEIYDQPPTVDQLPQLPHTWQHHLATDQTGPDKVDASRREIEQWLETLPAAPPCAHTLDAHHKFDRAMTNAALTGGSRHDAALAPVAALVRAGERRHRGVYDALTDARNTFVTAVTRPGEGQRTQTEATAEWRRGLLGAYQIVKADPTDPEHVGCNCGTTIDPNQVTAPATKTTPADVNNDHDDNTDTTPTVDPQHAEIDRLYPTLDWHAEWEAGHDTADWIVHQFLEAGRGYSLYAPAKTGKSLFMLELAACVSAGINFAGLTVDSPQHVLYVDKEMTRGDVISRLKTMQFTPEQLQNLHYLSLPALPPLDTEEGGKHILAVARRWGCRLVVFDTASRVVEGPENDADTWRAFYAATGQRLKADGITSARLDHAGKDSQRGQRGSSAKNDDVDGVWKISRDKKSGQLTLEAEQQRTANVLEKPYGVIRDESTGRLTPVFETFALTDTQREMVEHLDRLGVPDDASNETCRSALRDDGITFENADTLPVVKHRKARPEPGGTVLRIAT